MRSIIQAARITVALCAGALSAPGQGRPTSQGRLLHWMDQIAQRQLDQREAAIAAVRTTAGAQRRQK